MRVGNVRTSVLTQEQIKLTAGASLPIDSDFQKQHTVTKTSRKLFPLTFLRTTFQLLSHLSVRIRKNLFRLPTLSQVTCLFGATGNVSNIPKRKRCHLQTPGIWLLPARHPPSQEQPAQLKPTEMLVLLPGPVRISKREFRRDKRFRSGVPPCPVAIMAGTEVGERSC